jgi:hypothetical protein
MDDLTPWDDINPPMALARRDEQPCVYLDLRPATAEQFRDELESCLALVAPVGMDEAARAEWLAVAWATLQRLPADLLKRGCQAARMKADHPSKIVPIITDETDAALARRREDVSRSGPRQLAPPPPQDVMSRRGQPMSEADTDKLNGILEGLGATARYGPDGSRYVLERSQVVEDQT